MRPTKLRERPPGFLFHPTKRTADSLALFAEGIPVSKLAEQYGTPLYLYSSATIRERFKRFERAFRGIKHTVCYSVKANSNLSILRLLAGLGAGFDIVSGGELHRVRAAKRKAVSKIVFSGVGKLPAEIDLALESGILLFNIESAAELELLSARATHLRKRARFAVRVNPDVEAKTHPYISTGLHQHKFGVPLGAAVELYRRGATSPLLQAAGVSVHIGSQITDVAPFGEAVNRIAEFVRELRNAGHKIAYVDAGGGLGIPYSTADQTDFGTVMNRYSEALVKPLKKLDVHLLLEPGRAIVGPAGILVTRVVYRKQNNGKKFVIVDAAMNDLVRPALYNAHHEIVRVERSSDDVTETVDVVGPICETGDFFARDRHLPKLAEGDLAALLDAGAYGMALSSNYNSRPRAAEVLVDGKRARLVRKRESIRDLLAPEQ